MPLLPPAASAPIVDALKAGLAALAAAFSATFEGEMNVDVGELRAPSHEELPQDWEKAGVVFSFDAGESTLHGLLPTDSELLPEWCRSAEEGNIEKLSPLADQLAETLPDSLSVGASHVSFSDRLSDAIPALKEGQRCCVPLEISSAEQSATFWLVWETENQPSEAPPNQQSKTVVEETPAAELPPAMELPEMSGDNEPREPAPQRIHYETLEEGLRQLPHYARSLLKVRVPVKVTLASSKIPLSRVMELGHGSILQFQKSCEDPLTLEAGDQEIAAGEAVKVGDKFGLWITSIAMPEERFWVLKSDAHHRVK